MTAQTIISSSSNFIIPQFEFISEVEGYVGKYKYLFHKVFETKHIHIKDKRNLIEKKFNCGLIGYVDPFILQYYRVFLDYFTNCSFFDEEEIITFLEYNKKLYVIFTEEHYINEINDKIVNEIISEIEEKARYFVKVVYNANLLSINKVDIPNHYNNVKYLLSIK